MEAFSDLNLWLLICGVGFIAGFIDAIVGGGGMLSVPTLLATGLPPHIVLGTNKLAATFGSSTASYAYYRKQLFNPIFWRLSLIFTAIGAILGACLVNLISTQWLEKALPIIIFTTALYSLFSKSVVNNQRTLPKQCSSLKSKQVLQATTLGFYDGVAGPGTGAFWTASSNFLYKINLLSNLGLARSCNFISNICALIVFLALGQVYLPLGIAMGLFMMLGAWIGAHSAIKFGARFIRPIFITIVIILSIKLAYEAWL